MEVKKRSKVETEIIIERLEKEAEETNKKIKKLFTDKTNKKIREIVHPILDSDNTIENDLDNLHDLMFKYLTIDEGQIPSDVMWPFTETYNSLRSFLKNMKPLEKEYTERWNNQS